MSAAEKIADWRRDLHDERLTHQAICDLLGVSDLCWADLREANLRGANLCWADLRGANLCWADLREANLREANLCGADLCWADLREANLREANLCGADLRWANLRGADLCGANLREANLCEADLREADLRGANLRGANLRGANLRGANLLGANLRGADLCGASTSGPLLALDTQSGFVTLTPQPGWRLTIGCWSGTPGDLRALIAGDEWPSRVGEAERARRRPILAALADLADAHMAYWGQNPLDAPTDDEETDE